MTRQARARRGPCTRPTAPRAEGCGQWPGGFSFEAFDSLVSRAVPGPIRMAMFCALPEEWQLEAWGRLEVDTRRQVGPA